MDLTVKMERGLCIISVQEANIDAAVAVAFKEEMRNRTQDAPAQVILDLTKVVFIDSSGLGAIVATMKLLHPERKLILAGLTPPVEKVFQLTRMDSVFRIFRTLEDALSAQSV